MKAVFENVSIAFDNVEVEYPAGRFHVSANFAVAPGERFAILGPSGGGKSTIIKVAAGLIRGNGSKRKWFGLKSPAFHSGKVLISGVDVSDTEPSARAISLISQHSNLYPHLNVRQNLELVTPQDTPAELVKSLLEELGIASLLERRPAQISGGECQRVALAKADGKLLAIVLYKTGAFELKRLIQGLAGLPVDEPDEEKPDAKVAKAKVPAPTKGKVGTKPKPPQKSSSADKAAPATAAATATA